MWVYDVQRHMGDVYRGVCHDTAMWIVVRVSLCPVLVLCVLGCRGSVGGAAQGRGGEERRCEV